MCTVHKIGPGRLPRLHWASAMSPYTEPLAPTGRQ